MRAGTASLGSYTPCRNGGSHCAPEGYVQGVASTGGIFPGKLLAVVVCMCL